MLKLLITASFVYSSIYSIHFNDADGLDRNFGQYQGKKILLVNIATGSDKVSQLANLQQLCLQYQDSLVVIAFPSNSFGKESRSNAAIKQFCQANYNSSFIIAEKGNVIGASIQPAYNWLSKQSENGVMNGIVIADFQKFLIDKNGALIGVFAPDTDPMDNSIREAIEEN